MKYLLLLAALLATNVSGEDARLDCIKASHRLRIFKEGVCVSIGTGVAIDAHHLLTAKHVATSNGNIVWIDTYDDDGAWAGSTIGKVARIGDECTDLALIETEATLADAKKLEYGEFKLGESVCVIGAAHGECPFMIVWGQFVQKRHEKIEHDTEISAVVAPGFSGGGCWDKKGKFQGICVIGCIGGPGALMVPALTVKGFLESK